MGGDCLPVQLVQLADLGSKAGVIGARIREAERPRPLEPLRPRDDVEQSGLEMDNPALTPSIRELGVIRAVDHVEHY